MLEPLEEQEQATEARCDRKAVFRYKKGAERAATHTLVVFGFIVPPLVYFCRRHGCFHLTTDRKGIRRARREAWQRSRAGPPVLFYDSKEAARLSERVKELLAARQEKSE